MKQSKKKVWIRIAEGFNLVYRYILGLFSVSFLAGLSGTISSSFAGSTTEAFGSFNTYVCTIVKISGTVVGGLAVIMVIAAGIMYAASGGNDKGDLSMGTAKSMITSALSGVALYLLGGALLGACGSGGYGDMFGKYFGF